MQSFLVEAVANISLPLGKKPHYESPSDLESIPK